MHGLPDKFENEEMKCSNCIQSRMSNVVSTYLLEIVGEKTTEILELIHTEMNGSHNTRYRLRRLKNISRHLLTTRYSKCTRIFCITNKSETANCFIEFVVKLVKNKLLRLSSLLDKRTEL